ncbi:hypothetical protein VE04_00194 [Pseudogymnoascus sp. 24MN13]|nr:hypothetical protein VE04_00194 [Pseudogymnoascus sp. 24MN13]
MNARRSEQRVALCSSNMGLMLYAGVVSLFAMLLLHQVYASPSTSFVASIHKYSIFVILSPVKLRPIIGDVLEYFLLLLSRATSIKLPSASELLSSGLSILTRESLDKLVSTAHWATDKLFTCEVSYMITIAITSFLTKFFHVAYLRVFISTTSLLVSVVSNLNSPTEHNSLRAARQQFKCKICAFCCVIFTSIDYITFHFVGIFALRDVAHECWGLEDKIDCSSWLVVGCNTSGVAMAAVGFYTSGRFIWDGATNVLESWQFVEVAREDEAGRSRFDPGAMDRAVNSMKQREMFMEDEREEQVKEEALGEMIRLYEADETQVNDTNQPKETPDSGL